jgi:hypothetical protein
LAAKLALLGLAALAFTACGGAKLGAPRCTAGQLRIAPGGDWGEATGQHTVPILLTNDGRLCALDGFPALRLFGAHGAELPFTYTHKGDVELPAISPHPVRIAHGGHAAFFVNKYRCDFHALDGVATMLVTFPGGGGSRVFADPRLGDLSYCTERQSLKVAVTPFLPNLAAVRVPPR